jgi:hypothetical protein
MRMLPNNYVTQAKPTLFKKKRAEVLPVLPPLKGISLATHLRQGENGTATVLKNFVVEDNCIKARAGYRKRSSRGTTAVWHLIPWYGSPNAIAAASNGELWNAQNGARIKGGFTSNDWHWTSFSNLGEYDYTVMVNGADGVWSWNGSLVDDTVGDIPATNLTSANPAVVTVGSGDIGKFTVNGIVYVSGAVGPGTLKANGYRTVTAKVGNNLTLNVDTTGGATQATGVKLNPTTGIVKETITAPVTAPWINVNNFQIVVSHQNRLFFADNTNLAVYYLPIQTKSGEVKHLPLNAVFRRGGSIRAMYTWTVDGGAGMDDMLVLFSTNGECVIYKGTDPAVDFSLVGIFRFDSPLSKHSVAQYGGELYVLISTGLVPLSTMLRAETDHLGQSERNVTSMFLKEAIHYRTDLGWQAFLNPSTGRMFCNIPQGAPNRYRQFIRHMPKAVWSTFENIPSRCWGWLDPNVYFGDDKGNVYEMHPRYLNDAGQPIVVDVVMAWDNFKTPAFKQFKAVKTYMTSNGDVHPTIDIMTNFNFAAGNNTPDISDTATGAQWDVTAWDTTPWASGEKAVLLWNGVSAKGQFGAVRLTARINSSTLEINAWDVVFEAGFFS